MQVDYHDVLRVWREADAIPRDRARVAVRPPHADRRRPGRADLRGLDAALGPRRADPTAAPRPARDQQPLPAARDAGQDRHDRRRRLRRTARLRHRRGLTTQPPAGPARVRGARPALPRLRARRGEPRRGVHGDPAAVDRGRAVRLRRHLRPAHRSVRQPQARPAPAPADPHRRTLGRRRCAWSPSTPTCGTSPAATSTTSSAAAHCWTATAPRSAATPPRSPARSTCRSPTTSPGATRDAIGEALDAGFRHIVLGLPAPYPADVARWVADELITPVRGRATAATP